MSVALKGVYREIAFKYKGFDFLKIVEKKADGVLLTITPILDKDEVIYSCLIVDESYLYDLAEMIDDKLAMWIDINTNEIERIFTQLTKYKGI